MVSRFLGLFLPQSKFILNSEREQLMPTGLAWALHCIVIVFAAMWVELFSLLLFRHRRKPKLVTGWPECNIFYWNDMEMGEMSDLRQEMWHPKKTFINLNIVDRLK